MKFISKSKTLYTLLTIAALLFIIHLQQSIGLHRLNAQMIEISESLEYKSSNGTTVKVESFNPSPAYVSVGDNVTWKNNAEQIHTVTSIVSYGKALYFDHTLGTKNQSDNEFSYTFNIPGVFNYYCKKHPIMVGQVVVATK